MINVFSYPPLICGLIIFLMGGFVFSRNRTVVLNRIFGFMCLSIFIWLSSYSLVFSSTRPEDAIFWIRPVYLGVIFIPVTVHHLAVEILGLDSKADRLLVRLGYVLAISMIGLTYLDGFFSGVPKYFWGYYPRAGALYNIFMVYFGFYYLRGLILLFSAERKARRSNTTSVHQMAQLKYLTIAFAIALLASVDYLAKYGVEVYPFGYIFMLCFVSIIAYTIVAHQLMEIEVIIKRTAVFAGLFAFVYGVFSVFTIIGQSVLNALFDGNLWIATIPTVLVITLALRPLENYLTNVTEQFLFQKKYDYRDLLKTFTNEVLTILDFQKLTEQTVIELNKIIKLESVCMLTHDKETKLYRIAAAINIRNNDMTFAESDALISYLQETHEHILKDNSIDSMKGHSNLRDDFKKLTAQLCLPISMHDELTGVLCLGMKKSGEEYTPEDVDILMALARTLSIAIANAQLFDQLSKTQAEAAQREKMAVIGTLAAGINHEICNPLGIVRGQCEMFLLNLRDGIYSTKSKEDLTVIASDIMNKVIKETDRATAITKKLSGFAKPAKRIDNEQVNVDKEIDEVMGLLGHDLKLNNIKFTKNIPGDFPRITADRRQIQEVLFNIIRNAAQAMDKKDGSIDLSGILVGENAIIKIRDNGSGIPADKLGQIFNPFFTTKEPGKGTGLGLFIVKQVVERNKGTIQVDSQEGVGTTFSLTFPANLHSKVLAA